MFKEMRRKDKQLTHEDSIEMLKKAEYGVLSTKCSNGYPYGVLLNYVYYKGNIYFHSAKQGLKLENIKNDDKVAFCAATDVKLLPETFDTNYSSVVLFGRATEVFGSEKEEALIALIEKYSKNFMQTANQYVSENAKATSVIKIEIDHLTGKAQQ